MKQKPVIAVPLTDDEYMRVLRQTPSNASIKAALGEVIDAFIRKNNLKDLRKTQNYSTVFLTIAVFAAVLILLSLSCLYHRDLSVFGKYAAFVIVLLTILYCRSGRKTELRRLYLNEIIHRPDDDINAILVETSSSLYYQTKVEKWIPAIMAICAVFVSFCVFATPHLVFEKTGLNSYGLRYYSVNFFGDADPVIVVPDEYHGGKVVEIRGNVFENVKCNKIVLPESIKEIRGETFQNCTLSEIVLPQGITRIGGHAFENCKNLKEIVLPESLTAIGSSAFRNSGIRDVVFPEGLQTIGHAAFRGCSELTSVVLPTSVRLIDESAFRECANLSHAVVPFGATIRRKAFDRSCELEEVE